MLNASAAIAVARELGVDDAAIRTSLAAFKGVGRRFDVAVSRAGVTVIDDYGHHPTEVRSVLEAVRGVWSGRRIVCVFQPHRYSRTQALADRFGDAFGAVDELWVLPVYAAGEAPIPGRGLRSRRARGSGRRSPGGRPDGDRGRAGGGSARARVGSRGRCLVTLGAGTVTRVHRDLIGVLDGAGV